MNEAGLVGVRVRVEVGGLPGSDCVPKTPRHFLFGSDFKLKTRS